MTHGFERQRVAIAGTVINAESSEVMPYAAIRITHAPSIFSAMLMATLRDVLSDYTHLEQRYGSFIEQQKAGADTFRVAQTLLDFLSYEHSISINRQDITMAGGDGHYCLFDLPPGSYALTATFKTLDNLYGLAHRQAIVNHSANPLVFSQVDIPVTLMPNPIQMSTRAKPPAAKISELALATAASRY